MQAEVISFAVQRQSKIVARKNDPSVHKIVEWTITHAYRRVGPAKLVRLNLVEDT